MFQERVNERDPLKQEKLAEKCYARYIPRRNTLHCPVTTAKLQGCRSEFLDLEIPYVWERITGIFPVISLH